MLFLIAVVIGFHLSIILKIVPYEITWGGRLKNDSEMYVFEIVSLLVNFFLGFVLLIKGEYVKPIIPSKIVNVILWIFVVLFGLNTIGNLAAKTTVEKTFGILTLAFSILIWIILAKSRNQRTN